MTRSNPNNNAVKYAAAVVAVIAVAFCVGYFAIGGSRPPVSSTANIAPNVIPKATPVLPKPPATRIAATVRAQNGEYSAPGAPNIRIKEDKNPLLVDTSKKQPAIPNDQASDSESSQQGPADSSTGPDSTALDNGSSASSDAGGNATDAGSSIDSSSSANPATHASGTDPDTETVGGISNSQANATSPSNTRAEFRVQAGSFIAADNAKALAAVLKKEGYATSTHAERDGGKTVYRVQVGAYRTRSAAEKAANDLLSSGYPASVSPISP